MAPVAIQNPFEDAQVASSPLKTGKTSAGPPKKALPKHPDAVPHDYMYKFKYNHELPLHGKEGIEIPQGVNPKDVADEIASLLSQATSKGDPKTFSELFLEHGKFTDS